MPPSLVLLVSLFSPLVPAQAASNVECLFYLKNAAPVAVSDFSPDSRRLLTISKGVVNPVFWDMEDGKRAGELEVAQFYPSRVETEFAQHSPSGKYILSGVLTSPGHLAPNWDYGIWDAQTGKPIAVARNHFSRDKVKIRFTQSEEAFVTISERRATLIDTQTGDVLRRYGVSDGYTTPTSLDLSSDDKYLAVATERPAAVNVFETETGRQVASFHGASTSMRRIGQVFFVKPENRYLVAKTPDEILVFDRKAESPSPIRTYPTGGWTSLNPKNGTVLFRQRTPAPQPGRVFEEVDLVTGQTLGTFHFPTRRGWNLAVRYMAAKSQLFVVREEENAPPRRAAVTAWQRIPDRPNQTPDRTWNAESDLFPDGVSMMYPQFSPDYQRLFISSPEGPAGVFQRRR